MKLCILTGGSKGLGQELLAMLDEHGWKVLELSRSGTTPHNIRCDLGRIDHLDSVLAEVRTRIEGEEITEALLICNAGSLAPIARNSRLTTEQIHQSIDTNIVSHARIIHDFVGLFRNTGIRKSIVNISSGAATKGYPGWSLYCMGKAAIENLCQAIHEEEKTEAHPYRVISVNPFVMDTRMQETIRQAEDSQFPPKARFVKFKEDNVLLSPKVVARSILERIADPDATEFRFDVKADLDRKFQAG